MRIRLQEPAFWSLPLLKHMQEYGIECYGAPPDHLMVYAEAIARIKAGEAVPLDQPGQHFEILEGGDQVGYISVTPSTALATGAGGELHLSVFSPGQGVGERAFKRLIEERTDFLELESLILPTNPCQDRISHLLTRCGFAEQHGGVWVWRRQ